MNRMGPVTLIAIAVVALSLVLLPPATVVAQAPKKLLITPFTVYTAGNKQELQESFLRELAVTMGKSKSIILVEGSAITAGKHVDEQHALAAAKEVGADYVLIGSLTEFGERLSADVRLLDTTTGKSLPPVYLTGKGREELPELAKRLAGTVLAKITPEMRIAAIAFKGNRKIESSAIAQVLKSAVGNPFSEADVAADIKAIYRMGYFEDVSADIADTPNGKQITFIVQEKPLITEVTIVGNKAVSKDDIESAMSVKARQILNLDKVKADIVKIKDLYDSKAYYNAEVNYTIEKSGENEVRLVFNIKENEKLHVRHIRFEGNQAFSDKELRHMMKTAERGLFSFITDSGLLKKDELKQDVAKLYAFYLSKGFINVQIGEPEISHDREGITIRIPIVEGKQFRVGKVEITGDELKTPRSELMAKLQLPTREYYDREAVMKDIDYLTSVANDEGYAYATVNQRLVPNEKELRVDVTYHIEKGNQVYFHRIYITGNTKTRDKVIRRQLAFAEGELYSSTKLKRSYMELNRLRYFEEVNFQTEKGPAENLTDVTIQVKEKPTGIFSIGAGFSAVDGAMLTGQISQQNLFGRGQTLSLRAHLGFSRSEYELSFIEPWLFDIPLWTKVDLWNSSREYDEYDLDSTGFGFTFGYPIWEYVTGYVGYRLSFDDVSDIEHGASYYVWAQEGKTTVSSITLSLTRDTTDDYFMPSRGSRNSASIEQAGWILQGNADFLKYGVSSAWFFPLPFDTIFDIRGRAGYLHRTSSKRIPIYERFYLGGINSLRGLKEVGPVDPNTGDVIGGLTMMNYNVEFLFPLIKDAGMRGLIFFDTGNAWKSGFHFDDMRRTTGVGVRWYSPIGPLRLEWGVVLDRKRGEKGSRFEFSMGSVM